jgi:hypothetical protein
MKLGHALGALWVMGAIACGSSGDGSSSGPGFGSGGGAGSAASGNVPAGCIPDDPAGGSGGPITVKDVPPGGCPAGTHPDPNASANGSSQNGSGGAGSGAGNGGANGNGNPNGSSTSGTGMGPQDAGPPPALCKAGGVNNEPDILVGYAPAQGQSVGKTGQIKVWINDEGAPIIAPNEQVDPNTGVITMPGDRTAKAADGYLWEPALYISPESAETGGTPHFPTAIKGRYNNQPGTKGAGTLVAGMDPPPPGSSTPAQYTAEDIWDVSSLGLAPGNYIAEFVIHDGDRDRGVGCVSIQILP